MINQPLMEETRADYGRQYADRRVRALRFVVVTFLVLIVVGATLTSLRLMRISRGQAYIDASYPACRKGYALGAYGTQQGPAKLLLWSGKADSNCMWINELCDDMWLFDADTHAPPNGTSKWTELDREDAGAYLQSSKRPEPRWKTIAVQDEQENLFIFAGDPLRADGSFIDDVWKLSAGTFEWRRLAPTCSSSDSALNADDDDRCMSLERRAHAAAYSAGKVYMHGGKSPTSSLLNDMWALDVRKLQWTLLNDVRATRDARARRSGEVGHSELARPRVAQAPAAPRRHARREANWRSLGSSRRQRARATRSSRSILSTATRRASTRRPLCSSRAASTSIFTSTTFGPSSPRRGGGSGSTPRRRRRRTRT